MAERWKLTLREGSTVDVQRFASLADALDAMERLLDSALSAGIAQRDPARALGREFEPAAQVAVRASMAGPQRLLAKVHAGVDLHGDGSPEAWRGRTSRRAVDRRDGESAVDALRRELGA